MSMQSVASPTTAFIGPPKRGALAHIPGDEGWPVIGRTLAVLADPKGEVERMAAKYGMVYRTKVLGETSLSALGPEAMSYCCSTRANCSPPPMAGRSCSAGCFRAG
jgi:hypothetical protein